MTPANERKAAERKRKREAGLLLVQVWVPRDKIDEVRDAIAEIITPATISPEALTAIRRTSSAAARAQDRAAKGEVLGTKDSY